MFKALSIEQYGRVINPRAGKLRSSSHVNLHDYMSLNITDVIMQCARHNFPRFNTSRMLHNTISLWLGLFYNIGLGFVSQVTPWPVILVPSL